MARIYILNTKKNLDFIGGPCFFLLVSFLRSAPYWCQLFDATTSVYFRYPIGKDIKKGIHLYRVHIKMMICKLINR